jgi:ABC-2 type transport system ATP-binding protein
MPVPFSIELSGLTKVYRPDIRALDGIDLRIEAGSLVGLLGPNGSGKTTTVKILSGLIRSFEGEASLLGIDLPDRKAASLLGYMPQQNALYGELSVNENLDFFASINGMRSGTERKKRIDELLSLLDLSEKKYSTVDSLSGGMRQRVSLGCALIHRPRVLLLDEPTVGLDPELRLAFWSYFKTEAGRGTTILICTHAFDEVKHCSHLAFLRSGKLLRYGAVAELKAGAGTEDWENIYMAQVAKAEGATGGEA